MRYTVPIVVEKALALLDVQPLYLHYAADCDVNGFSPNYRERGRQDILWLQDNSGGVRPYENCGAKHCVYIPSRADEASGLPACAGDRSLIVLPRTVALRRLVTKETVTIGVVGCGLQGRTNLMAGLSCGWDVEKILCWNIRRPGAEKYREEMAEKYPQYDIAVAETLEETVSQADVLIIGAPLELDGSTRIIPKGLLKPGVTIAAVNGDASFLEEALTEIDRVFVDDNDSYAARRASPMLSDKLPETSDEIAELVMGKIEGRRNDTERILITAEGMAINDVSCAHLMYRKALEQGIGVKLPIFEATGP